MFLEDDIRIISEQMLSLSDKLKKFSSSDSKNRIKQLKYVSLKLCEIIISLRRLLRLSDRKEHDILDYEIGTSLGFDIKKLEYNYPVYKITLPFLLPRKDENITPVLFSAAFRSSLKRYREENGSFIEPIKNPVVVFENRAVDKRIGNGLKDVDNYNISGVLNALQQPFRFDDRNATLVFRNIVGNEKNETVVYVLAEEIITDFLSKNIQGENYVL